MKNVKIWTTVACAIVLVTSCQDLLDDSEERYQFEVDRMLYVGLRDGLVEQVNTMAGHRWTEAISDSAVVRTLATDSEGEAIAGTIDGELVKISDEGRIVWSYPRELSYVPQVAIDSENNIYAIVKDEELGNQALHKINPDGERVWVYDELGSQQYGLAVTESGNVVTGAGDQVHKVSSEGVRQWSHNPADHQFISYVAIGPEGHLYIATYGNGVHRLTPGGEPVQIYAEGAYIRSVAVDDERNVYMPDFEEINEKGQHFFAKYDEAGTQRWREEVVSAIQNIVIDQGYIYPVSVEEQIRAFNRHGNVVWTYETEEDAFDIAFR